MVLKFMPSINPGRILEVHKHTEWLHSKSVAYIMHCWIGSDWVGLGLIGLDELDGFEMSLIGSD